MGADEIVDWMAYELTQNPEFIDKIKSTPIAYDNPEAEAAAIKAMLTGLTK